MSVPSDLTTISPHVKRKPPPMIHYTDRYPAPDPADPFAPLSVLRSRTCSTANIQRPATPDERRRQSGSFLLLSAQPITSVGSLDITISATTTAGTEEKPSHYKRRSLSTFVLPSPSRSLSPSALPQTPPKQQAKKPWPKYRPLPKASFDNSDTSGTESDTGALRSAQPKSIGSQSSRQKPKTSPGRFARFLLAKKPSLLGNSGEANRTVALSKAGLRKPTISPPVISTVVWESQTTGGNFVPINANPIFDNAVSVFSNSDTTVSLDTPDVPGHRSPPGNDHHAGGHIQKAQTQTIDLQVRASPQFKQMKQLSPSSSAPLAIMKKRRISLTPLSTATNSTSSSSYINISTPMPSPILSYNPSASEDAYISPRPAPRPPPSPLLHGPDPEAECTPAQCSFPSETPLSAQTEWSIPTASQLALAASLPVLTAEGASVTFGSLFTTHRTIVIFIRHFWCPLCQDYMTALTSLVRQPELKGVLCDFNEGDAVGLKQVQLAVVSNGAQGMIEKYRQIFELPFKVYSDPELKVYDALGMGKDGLGAKEGLGVGGDPHQHVILEKDEKEVDEMLEKTSVDTKRDEREGEHDGGYVKHGLMGGIAMVVMRALKVGMPVWEKGGDIAQLGGEFVLGPGLTCAYAHRMQTTKDHAPIQEVLKAAGVRMPNLTPIASAQPRERKAEDTTAKEKLQRKRSSIIMGDWTKSSKARRRDSMINTTQFMTSASLDTSWQSLDNHTVVGVDMSESLEDNHRSDHPTDQAEDEEQGWMAQRQKELERLRQRKDARRGGTYGSASIVSLADSTVAQIHMQAAPVRPRSLSASVRNLITRETER